MDEGGLTAEGVRVVLGTMVNAAGLTLAKSVPVQRVAAFAAAGLGAAPVWDVFAVDGGIAFTDAISAVGDRRLRLDLDAVRVLGEGRAWGPVDIVDQDGDPDPACSRTALRRMEHQLSDRGLTAKIGHELEFVLVQPDGSALAEPARIPYGASALLDHAALIDDLVITAVDAGVIIEQLHAEYGPNQLELSLPPLTPVAAADQVVLTKIIIGTVARRHGLRASFSPSPFPGLVGNGAHQHLSLASRGIPLFDGGEGPHGLTPAGGAALAGLLHGLPELQAIFGGSVLSATRLAPGAWAGAFCCWGLENREAAVRLVVGGPANPHGGNVEIKIIDPSANVYLASAAILGLAADGLDHDQELPAEVPDDPSKLSADDLAERDITLLSSDPAVIIDTLDRPSLARRLLGDAVVDATVAVRRLEQQSFADVTPEGRAAALRLTWSI